MDAARFVFSLTLTPKVKEGQILRKLKKSGAFGSYFQKSGRRKQI